MQEDQLLAFHDKIIQETFDFLDESYIFQVENLIDEKLKDIRKEIKSAKEKTENELVYEMYKMKRELQEEFQIIPKFKKRPSWKWWK